MQTVEQAVGEVRGQIVLAQEDRFRIETHDGRSLLFVLGPGAGPSLDEVDSWASSGTTVLVRYRGDPNAGLVAEEVHPE